MGPLRSTGDHYNGSKSFLGLIGLVRYKRSACYRPSLCVCVFVKGIKDEQLLYAPWSMRVNHNFRDEFTHKHDHFLCVL